MKNFNINNNIIGDNHIPYIIAEVGQAHDGSLGMAHSYIDIASQIGVNAIKFQTHIASEESTLDEQFRVKFSLQDDTRYDYWKRMEFTKEQWVGLYEHAKQKNIDFLSSPFSISALEMLNNFNLPVWKVGSGEFKSKELLNAMIETKKPILYSTGMSKYSEIDEIVNYFNNVNQEFALLQCTSMYPTPLKYSGINIINDFKNKYEVPVGLSDHSGGISAPLYAIAMGANIIEAHIVFNKNMFGPDVKSSLNIDEFSQLIKINKEIFELKNNPVDKNKVSEELNIMRDMFTKSIATIRDIEKGEVLTKNLISYKKPGTGISIEKLDLVVGKVAARKIHSNKLLQWEDLVM